LKVSSSPVDGVARVEDETFPVNVIVHSSAVFDVAVNVGVDENETLWNAAAPPPEPDAVMVTVPPDAEQVNPVEQLTIIPAPIGELAC
jgi:hypothetical protein